MKEKNGEKRRYIRLATVLPVQCILLDETGRHLTPCLQGFTNNIGGGGICLCIVDLWSGFAKRFAVGKKIWLNIEIPLKGKNRSFFGTIIWEKDEKLEQFTRHFFGIAFDEGEAAQKRGLFLWAVARKIVVPALIGLLVFFAAGFGANAVLKNYFMRENKRLLAKYGRVLGDSALLREHIQIEYEKSQTLRQKYETLTETISSLENRIARDKKKYSRLLEGSQQSARVQAIGDALAALESDLERTVREKEKVAGTIRANQIVQDELASALRQKKEETLEINQAIIRGLYEWICNRQDLRRGLVLSYEGDQNLKKTAFTYDQALAAMVFMIFEDCERAAKVLDFYQDKVSRGEQIYNGYYTNGGVQEYLVYSGVNAWIGLAALHYDRWTHSSRYTLLAEHVADFLFSMMDEEGGVVGGSTVEWYSTEHNLDCYAFFKAMHVRTGDEKYLKASKRVESWLVQYAYTDNEVPVYRGKEDATIATDTYAWSLAALGPRELDSLGLSSDDIIEFAVNNCEVQTTIEKKDTAITVRGFDFAKWRNQARGGVISCEWSAQMIMAFEIMADYWSDKNLEKYRQYANRATRYAQELEKMIIISPSPFGRVNPALPYASCANADTGHGWRTPKGDRTGSLAATAYFLLIHKGFNPLGGEFLQTSLEKLSRDQASTGLQTAAGGSR